MRTDLKTHTTNGFPPPANGTEWFLFVEWNADSRQFWISYLDGGAFQVIDVSYWKENSRRWMQTHSRRRRWKPVDP